MRRHHSRVAVWRAFGVATLLAVGVACEGNVGSGVGDGVNGPNGSPLGGDGGDGEGGPGGPGGGGGGDAGVGGTGSADGGGAPVLPFAPVLGSSYVRKVKNILTGLAPTDAEVAAATDSTALATLIDGWMATPAFQEKMIIFFRNVFQQSQSAVADFQFQLGHRMGAFELPYGIYGDQAFPLMFQNLQESIARTALSLVQSGQPFTNILTTNQFMMTTGAHESVFANRDTKPRVQIQSGESPSVDCHAHPGRPQLHDLRLRPAFRCLRGPICWEQLRGQNTVSTVSSSSISGAILYQLLLGVMARDTATGCMEHAIQPYLTPADQSDWRMVTIRPLNAGESELVSFDLPSIRGIPAGGSLGTRAPRIGFYTSPAFLAVWNTNDSNQHRVTANQALLAALGEGFTSTSLVLPAQPVSTTGLDPAHSVSTSVCYGCHVSLDPLREFWANPYSFNDTPASGGKNGGVFAFANVNKTGQTLTDFGTFLSQVTDTDPTTNTTVSRFALAMAQQLCVFADSAACSTDDPVFRTIVAHFQASTFNFKTLVRDLLSSPLVTASSTTKTFQDRGVVISIARREQFCAAISNRLGIADICNLAVPTPNGTDVKDPTQNITRLAGSISEDAFSRGAQVPVTPSDPNLFFRAAVELVCENLSTRLVDATGGPYASTSQATVSAAIEDMVTKIMAYPPGDPTHGPAAVILQAHYAGALPQSNATNALRSTFVAACASPTSVSIGL